ncbi:MAG: sugar transferase [Clostridia bacterium]|nr:sugar transferase [Clostridia bacterium]
MYKSVKRILDFICALFAIIVLSPIMFVAAVLIKADDGGPALFRQKRPGKDGKVFEVYKFRTMSIKTEDENGRPLSDMERMTKIGTLLRKTSIDELPQFVNVLKGEMSFIGPRPLLCEYLELYSPHQARRHEVRPGISGWAQVNGRNAITWEKKFDYDVFYVDNISLFLDIKILFKTVKNVFDGADINCSEQNTMEKFTGSNTVEKGR